MSLYLWCSLCKIAYALGLRKDDPWKINVKKKNEDWNEKIEKEFFSKLVKQFDYQSNPLYSSSRLWDDGIIDPRDTRNILSECLQISLNSKIKETKFGLFRM